MKDRNGLIASAGSVAVTLALLAAWSAVSAQRWISPVYLPSPAATWQALSEGLLQGELLALTLGTVERMCYGWLLASIIGVALGAAIGVSPMLRAWLQPMLELIRPLPASSVMPVAIALFGLSPGMVLSVIAFGALWPVLLATVHGFGAVEPRLEEVGRVLGLSRLQFIVKIGLPNALADAFGGVRLALTIALILAVVGEMLAAQQGLGTAILAAARSFRSADLFAGVALLGAIGFASNALLHLAERRMLAWRR
ncbi:ABC transporter permease [Pseudoduganella namucuonensis]|uniref:ABC-type nitrate/sulfonate/bicarbonate transport system, permease component n=1 Tax=Pseudoduganella namucuonensis TaxID=1035707 RepID=A0A1I7L742_9BURK|nr:ABC transporter permease [Pseudoduganella namucuonensis]SFV05549.1 ABC-type nitrate/sulfonate/bicarbonate transport system, permease component [Pseudoduganella namucuonensis]